MRHSNIVSDPPFPPPDALEEIWTRDIVDAQWEILRYKKIKAAILNASRHKSLSALKQEKFGPFTASNQLEAKTYPDAVKELGFPQDALLAKGYIIYLDNLSTIENNIYKLECRRNDAYSLLAALGHDCIGALHFLSDGFDSGITGSVQGKTVTDDEILAILNNLEIAPLGMGEDKDFRISIAGVQEKTALLRRNGQWLKPIGNTATTHIFKPQIGRLPNGIDLSNSVENEFICLKLLSALGVPTASAEISDFGDCRVLIIERFDRRWTNDGRLLRMPQEYFCQALSVPSSRKYQSDGGPAMQDIIQLLRGSDSPERDISIFMRACILFWILGATDGHAKNFSIALGPGGRFRLTPLYDVLTAQPSLDAGHIEHKKFKLAMSAGKNRHYSVQEIVPRHFLQSAELAGVSKSLMLALLDDLAANAEKMTDAVLNALPFSFPDQLVTSIRRAVMTRSSLLLRSI